MKKNVFSMICCILLFYAVIYKNFVVIESPKINEPAFKEVIFRINTPVVEVKTDFVWCYQNEQDAKLGKPTHLIPISNIVIIQKLSDAEVKALQAAGAL